MNNFTKIISLVIALVATSAQAVPTLSFDGTIDYNATSKELSVFSSVFNTDGIAPAPVTAGSSLIFSAFFDHYEVLSGSCPFPPFCATTVKGHFNGDADASVDDLIIKAGDGTLLLAAKFDSLNLEGVNGSDNGKIVGILKATDGTLMSIFDGGDLFALQLNLNTTYSTKMYDSDFSGRVDGNIRGNAVPEPTVLALLSLGLLVTGFTRKLKI